MKSSRQASLRADMHIHSRYSDGSLWPSEIVDRSRNGIQALCLTDHDTMGGVPEFLEAAASAGLVAWPGVEIDCTDPRIGYKSEVLVYFPAGRYGSTESLVSGYRRTRNARIREVFERARTVFHKQDLDFGQVLSYRSSGRKAGEASPDQSALRFAKTDVFAALKHAGDLPSATDYREFRKAYFDSGLFSDIKLPRPTIEEIADAVHADGGVMVIPHLGHEFDDDPRRLDAELPRLRRWLKRFMKLGVLGVELYKYRNDESKAINELIHREAQALGFFFTHGSDCHGPGSGKDSEGRFWGEFDGFPPADSITRNDGMTMNGKD
ncbi:MAG: PHP domain-containing protein [Clostridia bacterium]